MDATQAIKFTSLLLCALFANIPLGYLREGSRKFSVRWFVYIHLSIPFIIAMRLLEGFGLEVIPLTIACAVIGQVAGGRVRRRRHP